MSLYRRKREKMWFIDICHKGHRVRRSTGTTDRKLAEAIHAKVITQIVEGIWFDLDQSKTRTLSEMAAKYKKERSREKSLPSRKRDECVFKKMLGFFGDCKLADITTNRVNDYKQWRLDNADPQTVHRELGILRNAFNVAIKEWEWLKDNPVSRITMPKLPKGRVRYLTIGETRELLKNSEEWFRQLLMVALHTGMRQGNIIHLAWDEVDLFRKVIILEDTKNGERLSIPINDALFDELKQLYRERALHVDLVFHREGKPYLQEQLRRALKRACDRSGIENFRFHDLRHTFASTLIQGGIDLYSVQQLLGHKDGRMTQRYAHLSHERLVSAVGYLKNLWHKPATWKISGGEKTL